MCIRVHLHAHMRHCTVTLAGLERFVKQIIRTECVPGFLEEKVINLVGDAMTMVFKATDTLIEEHYTCKALEIF